MTLYTRFATHLDAALDTLTTAVWTCGDDLSST